MRYAPGGQTGPEGSPPIKENARLIEHPASDEPLRHRLLARIRQWQEGQDALRKSQQDLEDIARMVSHDLQEPLRKISLLGDRLQSCENPLDEQGRNYIDRMIQSAVRMRQVFEGLSLFSSVSTTRALNEAVPLEAVLADVRESLEPQIRECGGRLSVSWEGGEPGRFRVRGSRPLIYLLLKNLLQNSLQFHREGEEPRVTVLFKVNASNGSVCEIEVRDEGIGFDEKYGDRIFQPFQRVADSERVTGTGMGLALCRKIVERHGGSIEASGRPGQGAVFHVRLPFMPASEGASEPPDGARLKPAGGIPFRAPAPGAKGRAPQGPPGHLGPGGSPP